MKNKLEKIQCVQKKNHVLPELISRLLIANIFIHSGWAKLHSLDKVIAYFESLQIPLAKIQAPFVSFVELIAGLFILLGLFTRLSSLFLMAIMVVAIRTAKWEDITDLSSLADISEFLYLVILMWLFAFGAQKFSLDKLISSFKYKRNEVNIKSK
ncbi:MAG: DoxX family protein [Bdellovibrionales bacterium]|nr:DoxX family protein [Bdellovibrionales bacterium]